MVLLSLTAFHTHTHTLGILICYTVLASFTLQIYCSYSVKLIVSSWTVKIYSINNFKNASATTLSLQVHDEGPEVNIHAIHSYCIVQDSGRG